MAKDPEHCVRGVDKKELHPNLDTLSKKKIERNCLFASGFFTERVPVYRVVTAGD